jgi:hypothetical protein
MKSQATCDLLNLRRAACCAASSSPGCRFALPIIHDLVAQNEEERQRVRDLVCLQLHYIISNGYTLIDADGRVTTWGRWDPVTLNMNRYFYDGRGLNALQILSWISSGARMCPDMASELQAAHDFLVEQHGYDSNVLNAKITDPHDRNDSDDELTFLPYEAVAASARFFHALMSCNVPQILHVGLGDQLYCAPLVCGAVASTQLRLHRDGPIRPVRSLARSRQHEWMVFAPHEAKGFCRYAIIARASGVKGVRDDDCTWDLQQSSTQVGPCPHIPPPSASHPSLQLILWGASNSQRQVQRSNRAPGCLSPHSDFFYRTCSPAMQLPTRAHRLSCPYHTVSDPQTIAGTATLLIWTATTVEARWTLATLCSHTGWYATRVAELALVARAPCRVILC